ncbi:hypothetical protein BDZ89DRAFT_956554 [Hymenopellis radicata]|nr:hypothetical protein BDZ89DRAFT_956554 [Hymenopellis radicata]
MGFQTLVVNASTGVELAFIDSGPPPSRDVYTTIIAVHGMIFTNRVFQKVMDIAPSKGVRFVALNRRPFPGSTPFTPEELNVTLTGGTGDADRDIQIEARGHEIATFAAEFIRKFKLPPLSHNGTQGGVALLGWSVGAAYPLAAIGSSPTLPKDVKQLLGSYIRSLITYEPAGLVVGLGAPSQQWTPLADTTMPANMRLPAFGQWVTAYFNHQDIVQRDLDKLSWILSSPSLVPTLYNIPIDELDDMMRLGDDAATDLPFLIAFQNQLLTSYRKAFFDADIAKAFPHMKRSFLVGSKTAAFGFAGMWAVQNDAKVNGGSVPITYKVIEGTNHFAHWDVPEFALDTFIELIG